MAWKRGTSSGRSSSSPTCLKWLPKYNHRANFTLIVFHHSFLQHSPLPLPSDVSYFTEIRWVTTWCHIAFWDIFERDEYSIKKKCINSSVKRS